MKLSLALRAITLLLCVYSSSSHSHETELKDFHGNIIYAHYNNTYKEIFRAKLVYGYGLLDDDRVFIASEKEGEAEAISELRVINLSTNTEKVIASLGCAGESNYEINKFTRKIIFHDCQGVKLLSIKKDDSFEIKTLNEKAGNIWAIFWLSEKKIGYVRFMDDESKFIIEDIEY